ncbi:universal stress protein [Streptomyces sp. NPDC059785]|uniref:universal stress protein n=1 Tax=unclassified Streptomyces TaxID=2593676 RepID=UPI00365C6498
MSSQHTSPRGGTGTRAITTGVDGSRAGLEAADWAAREAERRRLPLRLLHAGTEPAVPYPVPDVDLPARTLLDRAAIQLAYTHPALDIIARRTEQPAAQALSAAGPETETLVLGARGATGFRGFLVGSVALAVASAAARPVVIVRAGGIPEDERVPARDGGPSARSPYLPVVVGLDLDRPADELLAYAFRTAAARPAPLRVMHLHGRPPRPGEAGGPDDDGRGRRVFTRALRPWRRGFPDVTVTEQVIDGQPGHHVQHLLRASTRAGLLVVGRHIRSPRLGRTARSVVEHSTCPVAVVPHT